MNDLLDLFDDFQQLLRDNPPRFSAFQKQVQLVKSEVTGVHAAHCAIIERAAIVWEGFQKGEASSADLASILRQLTRAFVKLGCANLCIDRTTYQRLAPFSEKMSLQFDDYGDEIEIRALNWESDWLKHSKHIDALAQRRQMASVLGDSALYAMSKYVTYRSQAQKSAVSTVLFAPEGSNLLITLPTGGGKSMCILLPAWMETEGGRRANGTTIVIVPTVALALDQMKNARRFFQTSAGEAHKPHCLTGDTTVEEKARIYQGVREGTLPILYTSPESLLLNYALYHSCLHAAQSGSLKRIVIDEVHLVDSWGANFRPELQLLGAYCSRLREYSANKLTTLLMSATVSDHTQDILNSVFAPDAELSVLFGNQLRPEPSYWFHSAKSWTLQRRYITEALHHLPRPAILYVTKRKDAVRWVRHLRQEGYQRVALFTGDTTGNDRRNIINQWRDGQLDIIVATSAFGVGVDKGDVRTVIHATLPETIDRFYQEVGRGGRDGNSSVSLIVTHPKNYEEATQMLTSLITIDKAWERWRGMWRSSRPFGDSGNQRLLNLNAKPAYNRDITESKAHRRWNERTILMMQRAGMLAVENTRPDELPLDPDRLIDGVTDSNFWIQVRVFHDEISDSQLYFDKLIDTQRDEELDDAWANLKRLQQIVQSHGANNADDCLAYELQDLYPYAATACGGCPYCRENADIPRVEPLVSVPEHDLWESAEISLNFALSQLMKSRPTVLVTLDKHHLDTFLPDLIPLLVEAGIEQIIVPDNHLVEEDEQKSLLQALYKQRFKKHRILNALSVVENEVELYPVPTAIFYPQDDSASDTLFCTVEDSDFASSVPLVHVFHRSVVLASQNGRFVDKVNGTKTSPERLIQQLRKAKHILL